MTIHTACVITFEKENGNIIMRPRFDDSGLHIGDVTSMGWKVLDIHYQAEDGNYYHQNEYHRIRRNKRKSIKQKFAEYIMRRASKWR